MFDNIRNTLAYEKCSRDFKSIFGLKFSSSKPESSLNILNCIFQGFISNYGKAVPK